MIGGKEKLKFSRCLEHYEALVKSGTINSDEAQILILERLDSILNVVNSFLAQKKIIKREAWFLKLLKTRNGPQKLGLYLHGGVGTGKSMLMDIFYSEVRSTKKLRTHFHSFMQETHDRINIARAKGASDPILYVANDISKGVSILCFDEFQITDITDAMIVGRLFSQLISKGTYIVITSNRHPDDLYKDGLNRQLFLPFIDLLKKSLYTMELDALKDYRREKLSGSQTYFTPINNTTRKKFDEIWDSLIVKPLQCLELRVKGRTVTLASYSNGVVRSSFYDLCGKSLGALDYLTICENIKVLFIEEIPILDGMGMDSAKRFITLVDNLYENRIQIVCLAEQKPDKLYTMGKGSFEFQRTISRLYEMQSDDWLMDLGKEKSA